MEDNKETKTVEETKTEESLNVKETPETKEDDKTEESLNAEDNSKEKEDSKQMKEDDKEEDKDEDDESEDFALKYAEASKELSEANNTIADLESKLAVFTKEEDKKKQVSFIEQYAHCFSEEVKAGLIEKTETRDFSETEKDVMNFVKEFALNTADTNSDANKSVATFTADLTKTVHPSEIINVNEEKEELSNLDKLTKDAKFSFGRR